jgi:hypothetical protein
MKKFYLFMITLFAALAANAVTLTGDVYSYNYQTSTSTATDVQLSMEATIADGVVTFPNFLGSDLNLEVTVNQDGTAKHNGGTGDVAGSYTVGSLGTYDSVYFYGSGDFIYYEKEGVKYLDAVLWFGSKYDAEYQIIIALPEDFEPAEPVAARVAYEFKTNVAVSSYYKTYFTSDEFEAAITFDGENIVVPNYLGGSDSITYTIDKDGKISGGVPAGYTYTNYSAGTGHFYVISAYGNTATYDAATRTITDQFYIYENSGSYDYFYVSFKIPEVQELSASVAKWAYWSYEYAEEPVSVDAIIDGSDIYLFGFLGSDFNIKVTAYSNGKAKHDKAYGTYEDTFTAGSFGEENSIYLYAGEYNYDDFSYSEDEEGTKTLLGDFYLGENWNWYEIGITLPASYEPADAYAGKEIIGIVVVYNDTQVYNAKAYVEDNTLVFIDLFGASDIVYTVTEAGGVTTEAGWYPTDTEFDGEAEDYIFIYGNTKYDKTTGIVTDTLYGDTTGAEFDFQFALPEALKATTGISDINVDENAPVEYFNLQGVRVNNPASGLFIRRQGGKAQKVVVK